MTETERLLRLADSIDPRIHRPSLLSEQLAPIVVRDLIAASDALRADSQGFRRGIEAAARAVEGMKRCPFGEGMDCKLGPDDPCPVCGDKGNDPEAPVHCQDPAAVIRRLSPPDDAGMVERVAIALFTTKHGIPSAAEIMQIEDITEPYRTEYLTAARAAIKAMR